MSHLSEAFRSALFAMLGLIRKLPRSFEHSANRLRETRLPAK
jgi:hypothetical protein